jgi:hypothetical protein
LGNSLRLVKRRQVRGEHIDQCLRLDLLTFKRVLEVHLDPVWQTFSPRQGPQQFNGRNRGMNFQMRTGHLAQDGGGGKCFADPWLPNQGHRLPGSP